MTALAMRQTGLKPATKIVLYWLADHHNGETDDCFPSLNTLARECEMDRSSVVRHLGALEAAGLIERKQRNRSNGSQTSTAYVLTLAPVVKCNSPCGKTQLAPVAKRDPHNLGNTNLGKEPPPNPHRGRGRDKIISFKEAFAEAKATLRQQRKEKEDARLSNKN